jgi:cytoskeletal protein CcmA (bactofilin family)
MILKRRTIDTLNTEQTTVISTGVELTGTLNGASNIILNGSLEGNIQLSGLLVLGKSGKMRGQIDATNVIVEGDVEGIIRATEKVEIRDGGKCKGDIFAATMAISEKAYFEGNVKMTVKDKEPSVLNFTEKRSPQPENGRVLPR